MTVAAVAVAVAVAMAVRQRKRQEQELVGAQMPRSGGLASLGSQSGPERRIDTRRDPSIGFLKSSIANRATEIEPAQASPALKELPCYI